MGNRPESTGSSSGADPVVAAYRQHVDLSMLRKNRSLSHEQRFLQLMELQRLARELRRAGKQATRR